jgi:hypothetical protein
MKPQFLNSEEMMIKTMKKIKEDTPNKSMKSKTM